MQARSGDHHYRDDVQVSWPEGISLKRLRFITVGGFAAQAPLVELLVCLVHAGAPPSLQRAGQVGQGGRRRRQACEGPREGDPPLTVTESWPDFCFVLWGSWLDKSPEFLVDS